MRVFCVCEIIYAVGLRRELFTGPLGMELILLNVLLRTFYVLYIIHLLIFKQILKKKKPFHNII